MSHFFIHSLILALSRIPRSIRRLYLAEQGKKYSHLSRAGCDPFCARIAETILQTDKIYESIGTYRYITASRFVSAVKEEKHFTSDTDSFSSQMNGGGD